MTPPRRPAPDHQDPRIGTPFCEEPRDVGLNLLVDIAEIARVTDSHVGVDEVVVLRTERSIREWNEAREDRALERLRTIAREAAMQSHRSFLMDVTGIAPFGGAVAGRGDPTVLFDGSGFTRLSDLIKAVPNFEVKSDDDGRVLVKRLR